MLGWVVDALDANGVGYFLAWGTLLGAVRNQSIIPWTVDVDLAIPELHERHKLLEQVVCDDAAGTAPERCQGWCARGVPKWDFFSIRFPAVEMVHYTSRRGDTGPAKQAYVDMYGLIPQDWPAGSDVDFPKRSAAAEAVGGPLQYFCGTKYGGATGGTFLPYHSIYPLDKSPGVLVDGR